MPPISIAAIVALRTFTVMFVLLSAVMMHMCMMFRPWKQEWVGKDTKTLEFSIWKVCRSTHKGEKCYEGEYDNAPGWFLTMRWFLMICVFIQYLAVIFIILKLLLTKNNGQRHFWVPAFMSLTSATLILISLLLLIGYKEFEFLEESRMYRMGWRYEGKPEERWGWLYYMAWCTFAVCLKCFFVCMYAQVNDTKFSKYYAVEGLRKQAQNLLRS